MTTLQECKNGKNEKKNNNIVETIIHSCLELYPNSKVPSTQKDKEKLVIEIDRMKRLDNRSESEIRQSKVINMLIGNNYYKMNS